MKNKLPSNYFVVVLLVSSCTLNTQTPISDLSISSIDTPNEMTQNAIVSEVDYYGALTWTPRPKAVTTSTPEHPFQGCGTILSTRLSFGHRAKVIVEDRAYIRIRDKAGLESKILYRMPAGTLVTILDSQMCADGSLWWKILTDGGYSGWVAEYQDDVYLLEPIQ